MTEAHTRDTERYDAFWHVQTYFTSKVLLCNSLLNTLLSHSAFSIVYVFYGHRIKFWNGQVFSASIHAFGTNRQQCPVLTHALH